MAWVASVWKAWSGDDGATGTSVAHWRTFSTVYACFLGLQVLDLFSTLSVLALGGIEANPVGARAWHLGGTLGLAGLKLALVAFTLATWLPAMAWLLRPGRSARGAVAALALMTVGAVWYAGVLFWNLATLAVLLR